MRRLKSLAKSFRRPIFRFKTTRDSFFVNHNVNNKLYLYQLLFVFLL